ncbi:hypothetical protein OQA88_5371 [Cercophora sp. LCS_1]
MSWIFFDLIQLRLFNLTFYLTVRPRRLFTNRYYFLLLHQSFSVAARIRYTITMDPEQTFLFPELYWAMARAVDRCIPENIHLDAILCAGPELVLGVSEAELEAMGIKKTERSQRRDPKKSAAKKAKAAN